jgi:uncharacterized protein YceH (UPF0502 family)
MFVLNIQIRNHITPEKECHYRRTHKIETVGDHVQIDLRQLSVNEPADLIQESGREASKQQQQICVQVLIVMGSVDNAADEKDISQSHAAQISGDIDDAESGKLVDRSSHVEDINAQNKHKEKEKGCQNSTYPELLFFYGHEHLKNKR